MRADVEINADDLRSWLGVEEIKSEEVLSLRPLCEIEDLNRTNLKLPREKCGMTSLLADVPKCNCEI